VDRKSGQWKRRLRTRDVIRAKQQQKQAMWRNEQREQQLKQPRQYSLITTPMDGLLLKIDGQNKSNDEPLLTAVTIRSITKPTSLAGIISSGEPSAQQPPVISESVSPTSPNTFEKAAISELPEQPVITESSEPSEILNALRTNPPSETVLLCLSQLRTILQTPSSRESQREPPNRNPQPPAHNLRKSCSRQLCQMAGPCLTRNKKPCLQNVLLLLPGWVVLPLGSRHSYLLPNPRQRKQLWNEKS
jgi:hypothetical protein